MDISINDDFVLNESAKTKEILPLSDEEKERILHLKEVEKLEPKQIAIEIDRSVACVNRFLKNKGLSIRQSNRKYDPLSQETYEKVMILKHFNLTSVMIAKELNIDLKIINECWATTSYRLYVAKF